jgi:hypothetical protein
MPARRRVIEELLRFRHGEASPVVRLSPIDPTAIAAAVSVPLIVETIAGLIPARHAARMNPTAALRHD